MTDTSIPVHILTGFLGSGKTTFLSRLLELKEFFHTAILVNEFGAAGLDRELLENATRENIVQLEGGCLCCSVRGDLEEALLSMLERRKNGTMPPFNRIIIETTGLADPGPILRTFMDAKNRLREFSLKSIATVVDEVNGSSTLDNNPESRHQIALADSLIVTKGDIQDSLEKKEALERRIRDLNPGAPLFHIPPETISPEILLQDGAYDTRVGKLDVHSWMGLNRLEPVRISPIKTDMQKQHGDTIRSFEIIRETPIPRKAMGLLLSYLSARRGEDLLRVKGIIQIEESLETPMVIHGVQHLIHPPRLMESWPTEDRRTRIIFVTRNLKRDTVESMLDAVTRIVDSTG